MSMNNLGKESVLQSIFWCKVALRIQAWDYRSWEINQIYLNALSTNVLNTVGFSCTSLYLPPYKNVIHLPKCKMYWRPIIKSNLSIPDVASPLSSLRVQFMYKNRDGNHREYKSIGQAIDFKFRTLGYGFLFGNHKHSAKVSRLLVSLFFSLRFLKSIGWYGFSYGFLVVLDVFHQCFV